MKRSQPYYADRWVTLYCGDCREILPQLGEFAAVITDPVWPNAVKELSGSGDPAGLLASTLALVQAERVVLHLGCDSDPRILSAVPTRWPFFRACHLEYVRPHYKGRLLYTHDIAYAFGTPPASKQGAHVIPGKCIQNDAARRIPWHPCPRQPQHVRWLVRWFGGDGPILDPFAGSGTTLLESKKAGIPSVGIEISEEYCEGIVGRLSQEVLELGA